MIYFEIIKKKPWSKFRWQEERISIEVAVNSSTNNHDKNRKNETTVVTHQFNLMI